MEAKFEQKLELAKQENSTKCRYPSCKYFNTLYVNNCKWGHTVENGSCEGYEIREELDSSQKEFVVTKKTVVDHHADICDEIKELYARKNKAYGNSFAKARQDVPNYTLGKLYDKFNRFMNLSLHPENADFETIEDTLLDMANYSIMELAERRAEKSGEDL